MTVTELIRWLQAVPGDMPVAVQGYEGGVTVADVRVRVVRTADPSRPPGIVGELEERAPAGTADPDLEDLPDGPVVMLVAREPHWSE